MEKIAVLFDIDSTLLSVKNRRGYEIVRDTFDEVFQICSVDYVDSFAGKTDLQILTEYCVMNDIEAKEFNRLKKRYFDSLKRNTSERLGADDVEALPGAEFLLEILSAKTDVVVGLLTGNQKDCAFLKLSRLRMEKYFDFGAFGCESAVRTDLPPLALQRATDIHYPAQFSPQRTVVVGDAKGDIDCAKYHGISCLGVATGSLTVEQLQEYGADRSFSSFQNTDLVVEAIFSLTC